jgi:acetolactate synthase I/II/III large subunit
MTTVGQALVRLLEMQGVSLVFGIPGVHTVELYRGLAGSPIRHVTPRHEQGAGFMADGYARVSGKPGVAFVITGPGLTNAITAMAQARADSVPMLVVSGVNRRDTLGRGLGFLHELPDQRALAANVALASLRVEEPGTLQDAVEEAFRLMRTGRPGPVHVEVPTDVMALPAAPLRPLRASAPPSPPDPALVDEAAALLRTAQRPLLLAGGGARGAQAELGALAERLDAPVVTTANARGLLHGHPLLVPASPSLPAVRALVEASDAVLAAGTEFGPTDYDMYADGGFVLPGNLVRIDVDAAQLARRPARLAIPADARLALAALRGRLAEGGGRTGGAKRAAAARDAAWRDLAEPMQAQVRAVEAIRDALPGAVIAGDSTQPVYAANLFYSHDRPGGWFNAATGYGALGFGLPAAIGAALAAPERPVVCLTGDGGLQFVLAELGAALDAGVAVITVVWNNSGYREIEAAMREAAVEPVGVSPAAPDFCAVARAYGMAAERLGGTGELGPALRRARAARRACLIEVAVA